MRQPMELANALVGELRNPVPANDLVWVENAISAGEPFAAIASGLSFANEHNYKVTPKLLNELIEALRPYPNYLEAAQPLERRSDI